MSEVLFYHLTQSPVEATLPSLLEKSLERDWTVCIRGASQERMEALDRHLWTFREDSFLPHGLDTSEHSGLQPIVLTTKNGPHDGADVLMLIDGVWEDPEVAKQYQRVCAFFDGNDPDAVSESRSQWTTYKDAGIEVKYWAQENGSWTQKG